MANLYNDFQKNDQLLKIFEAIGTPNDPEDLNFIKQENAKKYIRSFPKKDKLDLFEKYPGTDEQGLLLLSKMLQFNPNKRITTEMALSEPYFDDVRIKE